MTSMGPLLIRLASSASGADACAALEELIRAECGALRGIGSLVAVDVDIPSDYAGVGVAIGRAPRRLIDPAWALSVLGSDESLLAKLLELVDPELCSVSPPSLAAVRLEQEIVEAGVPRTSYVPADLTEPPLRSKLLRALQSQAKTIVVGPSSSGKTLLVKSVLEDAATDGANPIWVNLADPGIGPIGLMMALISRPTNSVSAVVIDDFQCSPGVGKVFLRLWDVIGCDVPLITLTWPDALELLAGQVPDEGIVRCDPADVVRHIVGRTEADSESRQAMMGLANGDALVAQLAADYYRVHRRSPSASEIARIAYEAAVGESGLSVDEARALLEVASLGMFEIDARTDLLRPANLAARSALLDRRILRRRDEYVYLGHRTLARLFVRHLGAIVGEDTSSIRAVVDYLRRAGDSQIRQTLDRLDLISMLQSDDQFGAVFLARCWTSLKTLVRQLARQVRQDPTWGDNVASAVFAADAFAELGLTDEWSRVADYIRKRWPVEDGSDLPGPTSSNTAEYDDFSEIYQKMVDEDASEPPPAGSEARSVDIDRFHRTWVLGLLLGFEAKALVRDVRRFDCLKEMAARSQLAQGGYYPLRVPWVTARVCLGLAEAGEDVSTSEVARSAAAWLRTRAPAGPYHFGGVWRANTGVWNTDLEMTAMALLALGHLGVDASDQVVRSGLAYLRAARGDWYRPGKEIDCAQAIEAAIVLGSSWRDYSSELSGLLSWVQDGNAWQTVQALASDLQDESSKVPAVASSLITIIWETVRIELPILLQGIAGEESASPNLETFRQARTALIDASDRLIDDCREHVANRERLVGSGQARSPEVFATLEEWRRRLGDLRQIRAQIDQCGDGASVELGELAERLDAIGQVVHGGAWRSLPKVP